MERGGQLPSEDEFLASLKEAGECRIPFRGEGQEDMLFVDLIDSTGEYIDQLTDQLGVKVITNGCWTEELGHHLWVRLIDKLE